MKTINCVFTLMLCLTTSSYASEPLISIDDYTLAYYEKYTQDQSVRTEFERNVKLAEASQTFQVKGEVLVTSWNYTKKDIETRRFTDERQYLNYVDSEFTTDRVLHLVVGNLLDYATEVVASRYPLLGAARSIGQGVPEALGSSPSTKTMKSLADFSQALELIQQTREHSGTFRKLHRSKASGLSADDTDFPFSSLVRTKRELEKAQADSRKSEVVTRLMNEVKTELESISKKIQESQEEQNRENDEAALRNEFLENTRQVELRSQTMKLSGQLLLNSTDVQLQHIGQGFTAAAEIYPLINQLITDQTLDVAGRLVKLDDLQTFNVYLALANIGMRLLSNKEDGVAKAMKAIMQAINQLKKEMHSRFDRIEDILKQMGIQLQNIESMQRLSISKINEIKLLIDQNERNQIFISESNSIDALGLRELKQNCEAFIQGKANGRFTPNEALLNRCWNPLLKAISLSLSHQSLSPWGQNPINDQPLDEKQLIDLIEKTNSYGTLNLLVKYVRMITESSPEWRKYIHTNFGDVLKVSEEASWNPYPNLLLFDTFTNLLNQVAEKYSSSLFTPGVDPLLSDKTQTGEGQSLMLVGKSAAELKLAKWFMNQQGVALISRRLVEKTNHEAAEVLEAIKSRYLFHVSRINVDYAQGQGRLQEKFSKRSVAPESGGSLLFSRELYAMKNLQEHEQKSISSTPWFKPAYSTAEINHLFNWVHRNISLNKNLQPSFHHYVNLLIQRMRKIYPELSNYDIKFSSLGAVREEVLKDYLTAGCGMGYTTALLPQALANNSGSPAVGWCTIGEYSSSTDGYHIQFRLRPSNIPDTAENTVYMMVNPFLVLFHQDNYKKDWATKSTEAAIELSVPALKSAIDRALLEVAVRTRAHYIADLERILSNSSTKPVLAKEIDNCSEFQFAQGLSADTLNDKLCNYLKNKRQSLRVMKNLIKVYAMDKVVHPKADLAFTALSSSLEATPIDNLDLARIYGLFKKERHQKRKPSESISKK